MRSSKACIVTTLILLIPSCAYLFGQETSGIIGEIIDRGVYDQMYEREFTNAAPAASPAELRILRNTIYAKYGYLFNSEDLQAHFDRFTWYNPQARDVDDALTRYDRYLIAFLLSLEGRDWLGFLSPEDLRAIIVDTETFHSVAPPFPSTSCPCYEFKDDDTFLYSPGYGGGDAFAGRWRMSEYEIQIMPNRVYIDEWVDYVPEPDEWIVIGDLSELSFPQRNQQYFEAMGIPVPASVPLAVLELENGRADAGRREDRYSLTFLLGNP